MVNTDTSEVGGDVCSKVPTWWQGNDIGAAEMNYVVDMVVCEAEGTPTSRT